MGTVLSLSPRSRKAAGGVCVDEKPDLATGGKPQEKSLKKRHSVLLHALTWKRLVAASAKKKNAKKVNPKPDASQAKSDPLVDQLNTDNIKKSQPSNGILDRKPTGPKPGPIPVPVPTVPDQTRRQTQNGRLFISPRRVVVQASTGELLRCLSEFLCRRCFKLKELTANEVILWFRNVDRALLVQGWQDQGFITPANLVFVYLLCREAVEEDTVSEYELQATFLTCLYLAYSYMGNEISYPLKPFLVESSREAFWERALGLIDRMSGPMLRINADPHYFTEVFQDLKNEGGSREKEKKEKEKDGKRISDLDR